MTSTVKREGGRPADRAKSIERATTNEESAEYAKKKAELRKETQQIFAEYFRQFSELEDKREAEKKKSVIRESEKRVLGDTSKKEMLGNRFDSEDYELVTYDFQIRVSPHGAKVMEVDRPLEPGEKNLIGVPFEITPDAVFVDDKKIWSSP